MPEITDEELATYKKAQADNTSLSARVTEVTNAGKEALEQAKEANEKLTNIEIEKKKSSEEKLVEQSQFKDLADQRGVTLAEKEKEIEVLKQKNQDFKDGTTRFMAVEALKTEALKQGMNEKALGEITNWDLSTVTVSKEGNQVTVTGAKELVEAAKETKDYLFTTGKPLDIKDVPAGTQTSAGKFKKLTPVEINELRLKDPDKFARYVKAAAKGELVE